MNLSHMSCVRITDVKKHSCESFIRTYLSQLWKIRTDSTQVWQIGSNFLHLWQTRLTFTFERICHTCEEFARIGHTYEKFERILHRCNNYVQIIHTSKIRHLWNTRAYKNSRIGRTYISHIPKCDVFVRIIHSVWKIRSVNIKVQQWSNHSNPDLHGKETD